MNHQYRFSRQSSHFVSRDLEPNIWQRLHIDPWLLLLLLSICIALQPKIWIW